MKLSIYALLSVLALAFSQTDGIFECTEKSCKTKVVVGSEVDYTKTYTEDIKETEPEPKEDCNTATEFCVFTSGDTSVQIEGKVQADATKIQFTENGQTAFTYIKTDTTEPTCEDPSQCTTPHFVTFETDSITAETVKMPFSTTNPTRTLFAIGDVEVENGLSNPTLTCADGEVCITKEGGPSVKIEGTVPANAHAIIFTDKDDRRAVTFISDDNTCLESAPCTTPANIATNTGKFVTGSVDITTQDFDMASLTAKVYGKGPHIDTDTDTTGGGSNPVVTAELKSDWSAFNVNGKVLSSGSKIEFTATGGAKYFTTLAAVRRLAKSETATEPASLSIATGSTVEGTIFIPATVTLEKVALIGTGEHIDNDKREIVKDTDCTPSSQKVCIKVTTAAGGGEGAVDKIFVSNDGSFTPFKIVFKYNNKASSSPTLTEEATLFFTQENADAHCSNTPGESGKVPCTTEKFIELDATPKEATLPGDASYDQVEADLYMEGPHEILNGASKEDVCDDTSTICITTNTDVSAVSISGAVSDDAKYLQFSDDASLKTTQVKTYLKRAGEEITCEGACSTPNFVAAPSGTITASVVRLPIKLTTLKTEVYADGYFHIKDATEQMTSVCPDGKLCVIVSTSGNEKVAKFGGDFTGMTKVVFTIAPSTPMATYFSDAGTENCPDSTANACTNPAYVKFTGDGREVTLTGTTAASDVTVALWGPGEVEVESAFNDETPCQPTEGICTTFTTSKKTLELKGKITTLPTEVKVTLTNDDVWTYFFSSASKTGLFGMVPILLVALVLPAMA